MCCFVQNLACSEDSENGSFGKGRTYSTEIPEIDSEKSCWKIFLLPLLLFLLLLLLVAKPTFVFPSVC